MSWSKRIDSATIGCYVVGPLLAVAGIAREDPLSVGAGFFVLLVGVMLGQLRKELGDRIEDLGQRPTRDD